jgi:hypothetical protein
MNIQTEMRAFDPRDKRQSRFDARTWKDTRNPALILGTLIGKKMSRLIATGQFNIDEYWNLVGEAAEEFRGLRLAKSTDAAPTR